jgi:quercetin dioxygenase-like cupin family protein
MIVHDWNKVPEERMNARVHRKAIHTETMTLARLSLQQYAVVPLHSHENEQISMVEKGALKFVLDGREQVVRAGEMLQIPPHVPHSVEALEDSVAVDLFAPRREDWIRGDDAYLRR